MKTINTSSRMALRVMVVMLAGLLTTQLMVAQGWYSADWQYRKPVTVSNPGSTHLSSFQVQIILNSGNLDFAKVLKSDGSDIRVTSDNGTTLIPFWIERSWHPAGPDTLWVKVPNIPTEGTTVYIYYGNGNATITDPPYVPYFPYDPDVPSDPVETPPTGPFTRATNNPIRPIGDPGIGDYELGGGGLLAENIVYDNVTNHYWMIFSNYRPGSYGVGLIWSDTPTDPTSWHWHGNAYTTGWNAFGPHIVYHNGLWYIFFAELPNIYYITCSTINGTYSAPTLVLSPTTSNDWEDYRVDEPFVFQRNDGKWILIYMGDDTGAVEQIGYAVSDNITGPYTKFGDIAGDNTTSTPCIPFGPAGSFDAGTVADPWVYEYHGVYYIGYTVSSTTSPPWITAVATTTDWQTFIKLGVIFPALGGSTGWETTKAFRGAVIRIGDEYVFSYTGGTGTSGGGSPPGDTYCMGIATQQVFTTSSIPANNYVDPADPLSIRNNPDAVFDFYDGFDSGTDPDPAKWTFEWGGAALSGIAQGMLTLNSTGEGVDEFVVLRGATNFTSDMKYIGETRARHPTWGTNMEITEYGFKEAETILTFTNTLRVFDDYDNTTYYQWNARTTSSGGSFNPIYDPLPNTDWHIFRVSNQSAGTAGFQVDNGPIATASGAVVPTVSLRQFLMSYGPSNYSVVDWTRIRQWASSDPTTTLGAEQTDYTHRWTGAESTDWHDARNWIGGIPDATSNVLIPDVTYQPLISEAAFCNNITVSSGATLEINGATTLAVSGNWTNNGGAITLGSGTVTVSGNLANNQGTFTLGAGTLTVSGNWTNKVENLTLAGGTVIFNGSIQTIGGTYSTTFNNLTINSSISTKLGINTDVAGDLSITGGVFDLITYTCDRPSAGGTLTIANGVTLKIGGINTLPDGYSTHSISPLSRIEYSGTNQVIAVLNSSQTYGNLILSGSGTKSIPTAITITNNLSIKENAVASLTSVTPSNAGTLILGAATASSGSWGSSSSGATNQNDTYFSGTGILNVTGSFTAGTWLGGTSADWNSLSNWDGGILPGSGTDVIIPAFPAYQPVITPDSPPAICGDLTINAGASLTISAGQALTVSGDLSNSGTLTIESSVFSNGSLIVNGSSSGNITYNRQINTSSNLYHYFSSPVVTGTFPTTGTVWAYNEEIGTWDETTDCISGKGYTLAKGISSLSFTGPLKNVDFGIDATSPYAGTIGVSGDYSTRSWADGTGHSISARSLTNYGGGGWNLLGNPYTSAISVSAFIAANYNITPSSSQFDPNYVALYLYNGSTYRWVGAGTGWPNGAEMDEDYIQVGQGFFVLAMNDNSTFTFTRSMQGHAPSTLLLKSAKTEDRWPGLQLKAKYDTGESLTTIVYNSEMTTGLDPGYDVGQLSVNPDVEIYTTLVLKDNSVNFARQALPTADADKNIVPVGIDSEKGGEVTFSAYTVPLGTNKFWLEDRTNGTFTDLNSNTYTVTLPAKTYGTGRFFIIASTNTPTGIRSPQAEDAGVRIWTSNEKVVIKGDVSEKARCEIYDVNGQKIIDIRLNGGELNTITIPSGAKGVLIVRVVDGVKVTTRKVAVL